MATIDKSWHLAKTDDEQRVTEFELELWRVFYGFLRWQEACENSVNNTRLTGDELAVLHVIRMKDKPKTLQDIGKILNRDDIYNITYNVKKLLKMGLVEKVKNEFAKAFSYQITGAGLKNTEDYTVARRSLLVDMLIKKSNLDLEGITKTLIELQNIYDLADRATASYTVTGDDPE
jgi:predicted MarR family transcription regulator